MAVDKIIKYIDIKGKIKDITSENSNSIARRIINDNFKHFKATSESLWCIIDEIYDFNVGSLGSIGLHNDVDLTGISVGDVLVWNGVKFIPSEQTGGGGGGGAQFLSELLDVESFNLPLPDNTILKYDLSQNLFVPSEFSLFDLIEASNLNKDGVVKMMYLDANDELAPITLGADGTFLFVNAGIPNWSFITLDKISDFDVSAASNVGDYIIHYNGTGFELVNADSTTGIRNYIRAGFDILIPEDHQYIVHQSLTIDGGSVDVEGELVIL